MERYWFEDRGVWSAPCYADDPPDVRERAQGVPAAGLPTMTDEWLTAAEFAAAETAAGFLPLFREETRRRGFANRVLNVWAERALEATSVPFTGRGETGMTDDPAVIQRRIDAMHEQLVSDAIARGRTPRSVHEAQAALQNEVHRVWFRAGMLAFREYVAGLVERLDVGDFAALAAWVRAQWPASLGEDPGAPRQLKWEEVAAGGEDGPWTQRNPGVSVEALPIALSFLQALAAETEEPTS